MDEHTKEIILLHLHWIKKGFTKEDISKIHRLVTSEDPFQNVTMNKMQKEMRNQIECKDIIQSSDFEKITFLYLNYSEHILDLSFLKYCVNLEEINIPHQKLKNLDVLANLEKIKKINANNNDIENINCLYTFKNLEELTIEYNPIISLKPIAHLKQIKKVQMDEISDEKEVFHILRNNKNCYIDYIIKGNTLDYENFIFPKYHIRFSRKEHVLNFFMIGMNDNHKFCFSTNFPIDFPESLASRPDFYERYINKIKQETTKRFEKILEEKIQINGSLLYYEKERYSFDYKHDIANKISL
jgi:hypothetical protein